MNTSETLLPVLHPQNIRKREKKPALFIKYLITLDYCYNYVLKVVSYMLSLFYACLLFLLSLNDMMIFVWTLKSCFCTWAHICVYTKLLWIYSLSDWQKRDPLIKHDLLFFWCYLRVLFFTIFQSTGTISFIFDFISQQSTKICFILWFYERKTQKN